MIVYSLPVPTWSPPTEPQTRAALAVSAPVTPWQVVPSRWRHPRRAVLTAADGVPPGDVVKPEITREILDRMKLCIRSGGRFDEIANKCCTADGNCDDDPIVNDEGHERLMAEERRDRDFQFAAGGALLSAAILWTGFSMGKGSP